MGPILCVHGHKPCMLLVQLASPHVPIDISRYPNAGVSQYHANHFQFGAALQHLGSAEVP